MNINRGLRLPVGIMATLAAFALALQLLLPMEASAVTQAQIARNKARAPFEKVYHYSSINVTYDVNRDSTVNTQEVQTFDLRGTFHEADRTLDTNGLDFINNIQVLDSSGNQLTYSPSELDENDPSSWGKYTYVDHGSYIDVIWYYNAANTSMTWTIDYTIHGGVSFYKDHDELYWNVATSYSVPIDAMNIQVHIPSNSSSASSMTSSIYTDANGAASQNGAVVSNTEADFRVTDIHPYAKVTVAFGWPKGIVSEAAYRMDWLTRNGLYVVGVGLVILTVLFIFLYNFFASWLPKRKRTIVAEYEPPMHLPPLLTGIILQTRVQSSAYAATLIDLATRGYVEIEEVPEITVLKFFSVRDYVVRRTAKEAVLITPEQISAIESGATSIRPEDRPLFQYEKSLLDAMFGDGNEFSTSRLKSDIFLRRSFAIKIQSIGLKVNKEVRSDVLDVFRPKSRMLTFLRYVVFMALFAAPLAVLSALYNIPILSMFTLAPRAAYITFFISVGISSYLLIGFVLMRNALNDKGNDLYAQIKGFRLFLKVTDEARMEKIVTPDMFVEYLPYAMVYRVEKKWAKRFESMSTIPSPAWYRGAPVSGGFSGGLSGAATGFSASTFSSSFASSFSSAFASSGGGAGGAGGGGVAGGGGGGGGGGAR